MRRITIILSAAAALFALAPASALARHHRHHPARHHARASRLERFGTTDSSTSAPTSSGPAGTIASFSGGVLTITPAGGGSPVSGMVTNDTELECMAPDTTQPVHEDGDGGSGDQSGDGDRGGSGDDGGEDNAPEAGTCSMSNLTPGAMVREAELRVSSTGSVWTKVELGS